MLPRHKVQPNSSSRQQWQLSTFTHHWNCALCVRFVLWKKWFAACVGGSALLTLSSTASTRGSTSQTKQITVCFSWQKLVNCAHGPKLTAVSIHHPSHLKHQHKHQGDQTEEWAVLLARYTPEFDHNGLCFIRSCAHVFWNVIHNWWGNIFYIQKRTSNTMRCLFVTRKHILKSHTQNISTYRKEVCTECAACLSREKTYWSHITQTFLHTAKRLLRENTSSSRNISVDNMQLAHSLTHSLTHSFFVVFWQSTFLMWLWKELWCRNCFPHFSHVKCFLVPGWCWMAMCWWRTSACEKNLPHASQQCSVSDDTLLHLN